jgi:hypothetical protein
MFVALCNPVIVPLPVAIFFLSAAINISAAEAALDLPLLMYLPAAPPSSAFFFSAIFS